MDHLPVAGLALGLAVIGVSNIPVLCSVFQRSSPGESSYYCDEDGEATESSVKALGDKWPRRGILGFSWIGLACASAIAAIASIHESAQAASFFSWCIFISWVSLVIDCLSLLQMLMSTDSFSSSINRPLYRAVGHPKIYPCTLRLLD